MRSSKATPMIASDWDCPSPRRASNSIQNIMHLILLLHHH
jgi:hypothetical protein